MARRRRPQDAGRPPEGGPWIWHQAELLSSPAWRPRSINCVRLIEFLLLEHMAHGGVENGNLLATYDRLAAFGLSRRLISQAINEAEELGLVRAQRGGRKGWVA